LTIKKLLENPERYYDWRVRPSGRLGDSDNDDPEPIFITVNMYLRKNALTYEIFSEAYRKLTMSIWSIRCISHFAKNGSTKDSISIVPDTFFQNEKYGKKHDIDTPNILIRVHNGTARILYSCRLTLTLSCPMR
uniref:MATH domain-containing protein n=1 Tax=Angiostrongylus cantonensis TaxID=6313 RepID=A0A0K0DQR9_ANGCA